MALSAAQGFATGRRRRAAAAVLLPALLLAPALAGCGQKGPLVLPPAAAASAPSGPAAPAAPAR